MRIALVTDCYLPQVGGIEMQVAQLALHLKAAGHEPEVITPTPGERTVDGIPVTRLDASMLPWRIPASPKTFRALRDTLRDGQFDVVHAHSGVVSPFAFAATYHAQSLGIPTVVTSHCIWSKADTVFAGLDRMFHWSSWPVVFSGVSEVAASELRSVMPAARHDGVRIIPNGIEPHSWKVAPVAHEPLTFVSVMRLARRKRPVPLVRMFARAVRHIDQPTRLVIIGDGAQRGRVEWAIRKYKLEDRITLLGRLTQDEILAVYAQADAFVAPGNMESFGIAALEARTAGLPVIAKRRAGIGEFITNDKEGVLVQSDREMATAIARLANDDERRIRIAKHNRRVKPAVDWDRVVQINLAAYAEAAERAASGGGETSTATV